VAGCKEEIAANRPNPKAMRQRSEKYRSFKNKEFQILAHVSNYHRNKFNGFDGDATFSLNLIMCVGLSVLETTVGWPYRSRQEWAVRAGIIFRKILLNLTGIREQGGREVAKPSSLSINSTSQRYCSACCSFGT